MGDGVAPRVVTSVDIGEKTFSVCRAKKYKDYIEVINLQLFNLRRLSKRKVNGEYKPVKYQTPEQALEQLKNWFEANSEWFLASDAIYIEDQIAASSRMKAIFTSLWTLVSEHKDASCILKKSSARDRYDWLLARYDGAKVSTMTNFDQTKKYHRAKFNVGLVDKLIANGKITGNWQNFFLEDKKDDLAVAILEIFYEEEVEG